MWKRVTVSFYIIKRGFCIGFPQSSKYRLINFESISSIGSPKVRFVENKISFATIYMPVTAKLPGSLQIQRAHCNPQHFKEQLYTVTIF